MLERIQTLRRRRVVREGMWVVYGQGASALVLLVGTRVTTELVRPGVMGEAALLIGLVTLARGMFCSPVLQAQLRFYADFAVRGEVGWLRRWTGRTIRRTLAAIGVVTVGCGVILSGHVGPPLMVYVVLAAMLTADISRQLEVNFFQAARRQKASSILTTVDTLARPTGMVLMVLLFGASATTVIGGYALGTAAAVCATMLFARREGVDRRAETGDLVCETASGEEGESGQIRINEKGEAWREGVGRELWRYALPLVPLAVVGWVTQLSDRYLLGIFLGDTQVGIYAAAYALMSQPFLVAQGVVGRTLMPIYFKAVSDGDVDVERRTLRSWMWGTIVVGMTGFVLVLLLKGMVARFLLAKEYRSGVVLMPWIAAGYVMYCLGTVFESRLYARKMTGKVLVGNTITAAASIGAPLVFLMKWGMVGVAMACPFYFGIMLGTMMWLSRGCDRAEEKA